MGRGGAARAQRGELNPVYEAPGLLAMSAASGSKGLSPFAIMVFPALFSAGIALVGTVNSNFGILGYGIIALFALGWLVSLVIYKIKGYEAVHRLRSTATASSRVAGGGSRFARFPVNHGSKPGLEAHDETHFAARVPCGSGKVSCGAVSGFVCDAYVGRKLPPQFVPQPQPEVPARQPGANPSCPISSRIGIELELRLQDKSLREIQVVVAVEARAEMSAVACEDKGSDLPIERRQPLDAERHPAAGVRGEVVAHARLQVEVGRDRVGV